MEIPRILYSSPFMGNYFCEIAHYNMAFVAIAKNAVTYLKSLAIYAKTGTVVSDKEEIHEVVGYSSMNGYLYPVKQLDGEWGNGIMKFAVWRDPVERLVSCYKNFCLEYHHQQRRYFEYLDLCREPSFDRFMEFVRFELRKSDPLYQDEHIRRQSDYYSYFSISFL